MSSSKYRDQQGLSQKPGLRSGFEYLNPQSLVVAESIDRMSFDNLSHFKSYGRNILLLVDTEDSQERALLEQKVRRDMNSSELFTLLYERKTRVVQPYNEMGVQELRGRIEAMMRYVGGMRHFMKSKGIGTVVIGAIQSYIRISTLDGSAAEFSIVMLYNAETTTVIQGICEGVPVQTEYLRDARGAGFWDEEATEGKTTYGETLERIFFRTAQSRLRSGLGIANDWHWIVCGQSRHDLLQAVAYGLGPILLQPK